METPRHLYAVGGVVVVGLIAALPAVAGTFLPPRYRRQAIDYARTLFAVGDVADLLLTFSLTAIVELGLAAGVRQALLHLLA